MELWVYFLFEANVLANQTRPLFEPIRCSLKSALSKPELIQDAVVFWGYSLLALLAEFDGQEEDCVSVDKVVVLLHGENLFLIARELQKPALALFGAAETCRRFKFLFTFGHRAVIEAKLFAVTDVFGCKHSN